MTGSFDLSPLSGPRGLLMAVIGERGEEAAAQALQGGADLVQVRAKALNSRALTDLVRGVIAATGAPSRIIVNGRPDVAELTGVLGVHLGESGFDPRSVRESFPGLVLGVSRHDRAGLERAAAEGVDYVVVGPVFASPGKEDRALGVEGFRRLTEGLGLRVVGIGGVGPDTASSVIRSGALGVAALRPFAEAGRARESARAFRAALDGGLASEARASQAGR